MDSLDKLKAAIIAQVKANVPVTTVWATCASASPEQGTMEANKDGVAYYDVLLGLGDTITVPMPGSKVLLGLIENQATATVLLYAERIQEQRIHGNANGGLVRAATVRSVDAQLIAKVNALVAALNAWTPTVPMPTVLDLVTLKAAFTTWAAPMLPAEPTSYENPIVKHG
ncbi:MAG: hypothetical protein JST38_08425 [Bacteroidetes bacterium]|nr:hypothetical protein [Bacteroidota bacterium]